MLRVVLVVVTIMVSSSCIGPTERGERVRVRDDIDNIILPLKFGATPIALGLSTTVDGSELLQMVSPSQLRSASRTSLANGSQVIAIFDSNGLCRVRISDHKMQFGEISLVTM